MTSERYDIRATNVGTSTHDFVSGRPTFYDKGFTFQVLGNGNFELAVLATNFDPSVSGNFVDITSLVSGGATITANGWYQTGGVMFGAVRLSVTSLQSSKSLNIAGSWA